MGDTLHVGEELGLGQSLQNGAYMLTLQPDGNLVLSEPGGTVVWAAQTHGRGVVRGTLQSDGNFVLYDGDGGPVWATDTPGREADRLVVQPDRDVVLYGRDGGMLWSTHTHTDTPMEVAARTYTVADGDTLWAIAERFYGDGNRFPEIVSASGLSDPDSVMPGQVLTIP
ncbi:LysM peptidoglycan-binding domain-containing protein [Nocardia sp. alder85J]|uniref:LysM peptidoglycan-binding domain-containing protein n=1 Tax=Nocardia sp. alder85J TaxID=2862949 RepID=UPI001CD7BB52|nr:LysM peptidoglycan-binding domain-containing protein [Nocardia sp. alder85J]MCX4097072.1 LysM peptidoglycan-binding domain-containing protein [Nocardia sp. alder85J]